MTIQPQPGAVLRGRFRRLIVTALSAPSVIGAVALMLGRPGVETLALVTAPTLVWAIYIWFALGGCSSVAGFLLSLWGLLNVLLTQFGWADSGGRVPEDARQWVGVAALAFVAAIPASLMLPIIAAFLESEETAAAEPDDPAKPEGPAWS